MDLLSESIALNERNKLLIRKAGKQYNVIAVLFTILSLLAFFIDAIRLYKYFGRDFKEWYNIFNFQVYSLVVIVYVVLICIQTYYYYKAIKMQNKAIDENEQGIFDLSFKQYVRGNSFAIASMLIYIPLEIILFYQEAFIPG